MLWFEGPLTTRFHGIDSGTLRKAGRQSCALS